MGQKVHPIGYRLGYIKSWDSVWYADNKNYAKYLNEDIKVREFLFKKLTKAAVNKITIERPKGSIKISIHTARPGVVIGKKGEDVDNMKKSLTKMLGIPVNINIEEVKKPELESKLVADGIAQQLEQRVMFRRAMKRAVNNTMRFGAKGIRVNVSGRLNGAEIARMEWYREGQVPLHTLRADVDYGTSIAHTSYGAIGIKVWIYRGEVFEEKNKQLSHEIKN